MYEVHEDGATHTWGTVLEWDPPRRVRFTWHPGRVPDTAQEVESGSTRSPTAHV